MSTRATLFCFSGLFLALSIIFFPWGSVPPQPSSSAPTLPSQPLPVPAKGLKKGRKKGEDTNVGTPQNFTERFDQADYVNNWVYVSGGIPTVSLSPGDLHIDAANNPSTRAQFISNRQFSGDIDVTFSYQHGGHGQTAVGLCQLGSENWVVGIYIDTDDVPFLGFQGMPIQYPNAGYIGRRLHARICVKGNLVEFYVDGLLLKSATVATPPSYRLGFAAGSAPWKIGHNQSDFFSIVVN